MSCFNETQTDLNNAIKSILNQTYRDFEFIIILDNPKNKLLEELILNHRKNDKRIVFIKNKKNKGLASCLNIAIKISKGVYIVRMDSDDVSNSKRLEIQKKYMENNNGIDICFSWAKYIVDGKILKIHSPKNEKTINLKKNFFKRHLFVHPTLFCKREVLLDNLYDESFEKAQDFELWLRLIGRYKFSIIEKSLLNYNINYYKSNRGNIVNMEKYIYGLNALRKHFYKFKYIYNFYTMFISFSMRLTLLKLLNFLKNGQK
jgi:glycosyltransferase involved in cell wall biosynthesis